MYRLALIGVVLLFVGCQPAADHQRIAVVAAVKGEPLGCDVPSALDNRRWQLEHLKFYLSNLEIIRGGQTHQLQLQDDDWQTANIALLALEKGGCADNDQRRFRSELLFRAPIDWQQADLLSFELGVPFAQNHQNPLQQPSPLNLSEMFWSWRMGHKFMRIDLSDAGQRWSFHLGSTGCASAAPVRAPQSACVAPNRFRFELPRPADGSGVLMLHLDRLTAGLTLNQDNSCLFHGFTDPSCDALLHNLASQEIFEWR